jgi:hypothetical protein
MREKNMFTGHKQTNFSIGPFADYAVSKLVIVVGFFLHQNSDALASVLENLSAFSRRRFKL